MDRLLNGRLRLAVGDGWLAVEAANFPIPETWLPQLMRLLELRLGPPQEPRPDA